MMQLWAEIDTQERTVHLITIEWIRSAAVEKKRSFEIVILLKKYVLKK